MKRSKSETSNMGRYERTIEIRNKNSIGRTGKGIGETNSMNNPINVEKVSLSKIGRKLVINPLTGERKYTHLDKIPDGFFLKYPFNN